MMLYPINIPRSEKQLSEILLIARSTTITTMFTFEGSLPLSFQNNNDLGLDILSYCYDIGFRVQHDASADTPGSEGTFRHSFTKHHTNM